jgi:hypothetical protein
MAITEFDDLGEFLRHLFRGRPIPIFYKYRSWKDEFHKAVLEKQILWFPHPFDLEDPLDLRPPLHFNPKHSLNPKFYNKLVILLKELRPDLHENEVNEMAMSQWEYIKQNPSYMIKNNLAAEKKRSNFDQVGVLSLAMGDLHKKMWKKYADNHKGYAIGFKPLELCQAINYPCKPVTYSNRRYPYKFLEEDARENILDIMSLKKRKWIFEDEFRFVTFQVDPKLSKAEQAKQRTSHFPLESVAEVVLGHKISLEHETEILDKITSIYPRGLPVFKTKMNFSTGQLFKRRIS